MKNVYYYRVSGKRKTITWNFTPSWLSVLYIQHSGIIETHSLPQGLLLNSLKQDARKQLLHQMSLKTDRLFVEETGFFRWIKILSSAHPSINFLLKRFISALKNVVIKNFLGENRDQIFASALITLELRSRENICDQPFLPNILLSYSPHEA